MIQEILDEVLDTSLQPDVNPRYVIKDNNGKVINDNVQIDLKTPVVTEGTPLNRATLVNLQGDLYTQDRYNVPVVSYDGTNYVFNIDLPLTSYESGKIVNLQATAFEEVTTFDNPYININQLGTTQILGQIRADKYYNLVFDGAVWLPQVTNIGVGSEPIVITESGTYEVDPDVRYKVIAVGGGGGACIGYSRHYGEYAGVNGGGAGGIIEDILIPESTTVNVTIGAASGNEKFYGDYGAGTGTTPKAGDTTIGKFTAYGGYGGSNEKNVETSGVGGSYTGGAGRNGESANNTTYYGNGGNGLTINGVEYGAGGSYGYDWSHDLTLNEPATNGIVILYPLV